MPIKQRQCQVSLRIQGLSPRDGDWVSRYVHPAYVNTSPVMHIGDFVKIWLLTCHSVIIEILSGGSLVAICHNFYIE